MKLLVCTDGSNSSQLAVREAIKLAEKIEGTEITLLYVFEVPQLSEFDSEGGRRIPGLQEKLELSRRVEGEKVLGEALTEFEKRNIKVRTELIKGYPSQEIVSYAAENDFDYIVMGSRGLSGLKKLFLGSVSNAVAQEAKNNIILVKQQL